MNIFAVAATITTLILSRLKYSHFSDSRKLFAVYAELKDYLNLVKKIFNYVWSALSFNATTEDQFFAYVTPLFSIKNSDSEDEDEQAPGKVNSPTVTQFALWSKNWFMSP